MDTSADVEAATAYHRLDGGDDEGHGIDIVSLGSNSESDEEGVFLLQSVSDEISEGQGTDLGGGEDDYVLVPQSRITHRNLLNLLAYLSSLFVHYAIGIWGLNGLIPTIREVTDAHRTLLTPADWTHWIWALIYSVEAIFILAQLTPKYRSVRVVLQGAGYFFVYSCMAQIAWTVLYTLGKFLPAFVMMLTNLVAMCFVIMSQFLAQSRGESRTEYFLLRFPFSLHVGWVFVETATNFSMWSQSFGVSQGWQVCAAIVSLGILLMVASLFLGARTAKGLVVPSVIIWAFVGIGLALRHPAPSIIDMYEDSVISGVRRASLSFAVIVSSVLASRLGFHVAKECFTIRIVEH